MKKSKLLALILAVTMMFSVFAACSQSPEEPTKTTKESQGTTSSGGEEPAAGIPLDEIKIGAIFNTNKEDGGWSQAMYESFLRAQEELGLRDDQLVMMEEIADTGTVTENALEMLVDSGCNMIFGCSSGYTNPTAITSERYPDVYFHQFEGKTTDNLASFTIRDYQAIFMCGYAAAKMSSVDELGFVAAQPQASVVRAINAWSEGAEYANPDATVKVVWSNSWYDPAADKENANSLFDSGIEALGYHGSTTAVMQAAGEKGGYATGFHIDMESYAPDAVLTSFVWNWTPIFVEFIEEAVAGTWTNQTKFKGMEEGAASIAPYNEEIMPAEVIADCQEVEAKVNSGEVKVFEGPLYDNKGNLVLEEGEEFSDEEWIGMMYLADNVIGDLP